jgi:hypothetical protein
MLKRKGLQSLRCSALEMEFNLSCESENLSNKLENPGKFHKNLRIYAGPFSAMDCNYKDE